MKNKVLTFNQSNIICNGQVKKVDIGSSPHVLIADDDNAGGEVTKHSNNKEDAVDNCERETRWPINLRFTKNIFYEVCYVFILNCSVF